MSARWDDNYLRARALRVVNSDDNDYPVITRTLAIGVLDLLDQRGRGAALAEERLDAELAEVRDGIATLATATVSIGTYRANRQADQRSLERVASMLQLLEQRVNGVAARVDTLDARTLPGRQ